MFTHQEHKNANPDVTRALTYMDKHYGDEPHTFTEIAEFCGVHHSVIQEIYNSAIKKVGMKIGADLKDER